MAVPESKQTNSIMSCFVILQASRQAVIKSKEEPIYKPRAQLQNQNGNLGLYLHIAMKVYLRQNSSN